MEEQRGSSSFSVAGAVGGGVVSGVGVVGGAVVGVVAGGAVLLEDDGGQV